MTRQWEYNVVAYQDDLDYFEELNALGEHGWEVCGVVAGDENTLPRIILKREVEGS